MTETDKTAMRPIIRLAETLPTPVLKTIVIEAIYKHRHLRDIAELRHVHGCNDAECNRAGGSGRSAYVRAMIDMHAQQMVLSALLDVLGYVPETSAG